MATSIHLEHAFQCSADALYGLVSDTTFDAELLEAIAVDAEVLDYDERPGARTLRYRFRPRRKIPPGLKKVMSKPMEWVEERAWTDLTRTHTWKITPGFAPKRATIEGTYQILERSDGHAIRVIRGTFGVRAPVVGKAIERFLVRQTTDAFDRGADYIRMRLDETEDDAS